MVAPSAIVTAPPYADYLGEVVRHPLVGGLRLNTVMPVADGPGEALDRLMSLDAPLWVDLKGRQLRVREAAVPPYTALLLSHSITVPTPTEGYLSDGRERIRIERVDGARLILGEAPRRLIGPGESVNIPHPALEIHGGLTETDRSYLEAMKERGLRRVMLSFVERKEDVDDIRSLLPGAEVLAKIENRRGLDFARNRGDVRLVAARGDLFVEVGRPHRVVSALRSIIEADPEAVVASRFFADLVHHPVPTSADICDVAFLLTLGYRTVMLGDDLCFRKDTVLEALNLLEAIAGEIP